MQALDYLIEFRKRLIFSLGVITCFFCFFYFFSHQLLYDLVSPLLKTLPYSKPIIATNIPSVFFVPIKLAFVVSVFISMPFLLYQGWKFITPALYQKEKKMLWSTFVFSLILFYLGVFFAYFVSLPLVLNFLVKVTPNVVDIRPDIQSYLSFTFGLLFAFGFGFQTPVIILLLIKSNITTIQQLKKSRMYIVLGVLTISMLITPPDVVSQILLAIPILLLFELGLWVAFFQQYHAVKKQE